MVKIMLSFNGSENFLKSVSRFLIVINKKLLFKVGLKCVTKLVESARRHPNACCAFYAEINYKAIEGLQPVRRQRRQQPASGWGRKVRRKDRAPGE